VRLFRFVKIKLPGLLCLLISCSIQAQSSVEIQGLKINIPDKNYHIAYSHAGIRDVDMYSGMMFRFYKMYISSQDYGNCSFTPSCSEYAMTAIREQGIFVGSVNALDRLTRCHGGNKHNYFTDERTGLSVDEVRNIKYEKD
jgi:uncharacterized protein